MRTRKTIAESITRNLHTGSMSELVITASTECIAETEDTFIFEDNSTITMFGQNLIVGYIVDGGHFWDRLDEDEKPRNVKDIYQGLGG